MKKIGFIGAGNMATAIIGSLMGQNDGKADFINVFDLDKEKCDIMSKKGINIKKSAADVMLESNITVLAVKPQNYPEVLEALKTQVTDDKVFVSIAAGISIAYVQNLLDCKCPVVRVMPNTPLLLGKGASALCPSDNISEEDKQIVYNMFAGSGVCEYIAEEHMNEITVYENTGQYKEIRRSRSQDVQAGGNQRRNAKPCVADDRAINK